MYDLLGGDWRIARGTVRVKLLLAAPIRSFF
jgi:hypothetical protein